jgi:radical SAM superfamily enzyme YgiQ (UPF0313 family)
MRGIIVGDNFYDEPRTSITRTTGAHRMATLFRNKGIDVEVLDFFNSWSLYELAQFLLKYKTLDFIGISIGLGSLKSSLVNPFILISKKLHPNIKVIAGGTIVLLDKSRGIDLYIRGFAEGAVNDIIKYIKTGRYPNMLYVEEIKTHDVKKVIDCDKHYKNFNLDNLRTTYTDNDFISPLESLVTETSRGCIFKCKFCNFPLTGKKKNDYIRDRDSIEKELLYNYQKWGITRYSITDDTFNDNPVKVDMLYEISKNLPFKLEFVCFIRIDLLYTHKEMLDKLVDSGARGMFFGIETWNEETGRAIGKKFTGDKLRNYLLYIKKKYPQLHLTASMIVGLPGESAESFRADVLWARDNNIFSCTILFPLNIYKDNFVNYISPFTKEWDKHGYQKISFAEATEILKSYPDYVDKVDLDYYDKHHILWKNEHMNFIDSIVLSDSIRQEIDINNTLGGWACLTMTHTGIPFDKLLATTKLNLDWDLIFSKTKEFTDNYKKKKLSINLN